MHTGPKNQAGIDPDKDSLASTGRPPRLSPGKHFDDEGSHTKPFGSQLLPFSIRKAVAVSKHPALLLPKPKEKPLTRFALEEYIVERGFRPDSQETVFTRFPAWRVTPTKLIDQESLRRHHRARSFMPDHLLNSTVSLTFSQRWSILGPA
jgi:hypothetical protein